MQWAPAKHRIAIPKTDTVISTSATTHIITDDNGTHPGSMPEWNGFLKQ